MKNVRSSFLHKYPCPITTAHERLKKVIRGYEFDYSLHRYPFIVNDMAQFLRQIL
jgi:hypothetical protein